MRANLKSITPFGVLGVLAACAAIQVGAGVTSTTANPLVDEVIDTIETITDQVPEIPDDMHW